MTPDQIKQRIETAIPGANAYVLDPMNDGAHLQAYVISPVFEGMPVFKQQQMVMAAVKDIFQIVHALGLKTFTPAKWSEVKVQYGF
jgi:acid stress-induced BolA-like protein IbaG/YrbA